MASRTDAPYAVPPHVAVTEEKSDKPTYAVGLTTFVIVAIGVGIVWLLGFVQSSEIASADKTVASVTSDLAGANLAKTATDYQSLAALSEQLPKLKSTQLPLTTIWQAAKASTPKDVQWTSFSISSSKSVQISGSAGAIGSISQFAVALEDTGRFTGVEPVSITKNNNQFNFVIAGQARVGTSGGANE